MTDALRQTDCWIFDLDNTLYPAACNLFVQVDGRIRQFIMELLDMGPKEARRIQKSYFHAYGTTLNGLMRNHDIAPEEFLDYVHDIDVSPVPPSPDLETALERLRGKKLGYTNGSVPHAERVMVPSRVVVVESDLDSYRSCARSYPCFQPFAYSVDAFFPIVDLHQEG